MNKLKEKRTDIVTHRYIDLVSIAALYHDIGHGPFSHALDRITENSHEARSKIILEHVIRKNNIQVSEDELHFLYELIDPSTTIRNDIWINQILNNTVFDCDRADYLLRDSKATGVPIQISVEEILTLICGAYIDTNNSIRYEAGEQTIRNIKNSRDTMYNEVYRNDSVKKYEEIIM